jgi:PhzF family phenazine biosynthesis protein
MTLDFYQVDAFTSQTFSGNPAAVIPLESWLPESLMLKIAAENNLSETAFFVPEGESFGIRWFTPHREVDLCGHATLASAFILFEQLGWAQEQVLFQSLSGKLRVKKSNRKFWLDFPARPGEPVDSTLEAALSEALGAKPSQVLRSRDLMAVFSQEAEVAGLSPDFRKLAALDAMAVIVTAPGNEADFVSRFFAPQVGIDEDPVTGSAHCTLIPFWSERLGKPELEARQISGRGGEISCRWQGDRVLIGGEASLVIRGQFYLETDSV